MTYTFTKQSILNTLLGGYMRNIGQYKKQGPFGTSILPGNWYSALATQAATTAGGYGLGWLADKWRDDEEDPYKMRTRLGLLGLGGGLALNAVYNTPISGAPKSASFVKKALMNFYSDSTGVPVHHTISMIYNDPVLSMQEKGQATSYLYNASGNDGRGLVTPTRIAQAAIGAGIGYGAATLFGKTMDGIFGGLPTSTQKKLQTAGIIGGMLLNTGAL